MYDAYTLDLIAEIATNGNVQPTAIVLKSPGNIMVGSIKGTLQLFSFSKHQAIFKPVTFGLEILIEIPGAGEIY